MDCQVWRRGLVSVAMSLLLLAPATGLTTGRDHGGSPPALDSGTPLTLQVNPKSALAGTPVQALVRVHPDVQNRLLRVSVESSGYFRSSDMTLNGADAPVSHFVRLRALPAGRYDVVAVVYGSEGERARSLQKFELRSPHEGN